MYCNYCGAPLAVDADYCPQCQKSQVKQHLGPAVGPSSSQGVYPSDLIPPSTASGLPTIVRSELRKLPPDQQGEFLEEYKRKAKSKGTAYVLWFLFGWHYAYVGKWGIQVLFWITWGGLFIWWLADLFRIPSIISDYNKDVAVDVLRDMKIISG